MCRLGTDPQLVRHLHRPDILPGHLRGLQPGQPSGRGQSLAYYLPTTEVSVMWFVAVLLAFSVAYAALRYVRPAAQSRLPLRPGVLAAARGVSATIHHE